MNQTTPTEVAVKNCRRCNTSPVIFRATCEANDVWVIACPCCGLQIVGKRVEGLSLDNMELVEVTKHGDDLDDLIKIWNTDPIDPEGGVMA